MSNNRNKRGARNNSSNYKSKGSKQKFTRKNQVGNSSDKADMSYEETKHKYNDISWYAKNSDMLRDSASFSYNNPVGTLIDLSKIYGKGTLTAQTAVTSVPGLMSLKYVICPGLSMDSSSPANLAAQNIYTYVRYMNSGAKNYDQADLMLYLLAMDSIYAMWNWLKRMYGYLRTYSQVNKYMPKGYAAADALDFDNAIANMADFRYQLNALAAQISAFCVPAVMPIFIRHSWMASNIYKDADGMKAQQYMYSPAGYYTYSETSSQYGGQLVWTKFPYNESTRGTYSQYCSILKTMIDAVAYSEDIGVMSGDILKAYGQDKLFKLTPVEADYLVLPVYNEEVLNQLHNSICLSTFLSTNPEQVNSHNITQDPDSGFLVWNPTWQSASWTQTAAMINMPWDNVTPDNTMIATRLTALELAGTNSESHLICCGSEIICARQVFRFMASSHNIASWSVPTFIQIGVADTQNTSEIIAMLSNFDWHPLVPLVGVVTNGEAKTYRINAIMGDISNYTIIDSYSITQMHTAALLSEFNVPQIGSF